MTALIELRDLTIGFGDGPSVVDGVSMDVVKGRTLALVGESGSGKTLTCRSFLGLLPGTAQIRSGRAMLAGEGAPQDILTLSDRQLRRIRGNRISMIFQEPMRSLSPLHRIGNQVAEVLRLHRGLGGAAARARVIAAFERVGFPDPEVAWSSYPFEMSGGMRQRAMIAMAAVAEPELMIADEPTTALDVTTQAQVLGLLKELQAETGMALVLVTHDLGVVANMADDVVVMCRGRVVERGPAAKVLVTPGHGYTQKLFAAAPAIPHPDHDAAPVPHDDVVLDMADVTKTYHLKASAPWRRGAVIDAVRGVSLQVVRGRTLAIVGESGSGKTTCARIALGAEPPDPGGTVRFRARAGAPQVDLPLPDAAARRAFQREAQMVFQDPYSTLNPRMRVREALFEPMEIHGLGRAAEREARAVEMLEWVGLSPNMLTRYPHAFSGGQRQRLSIARALMLGPSFLVCDEPTSALDVSVQEQILQLLEDIRDRLHLSYLFISHDLAVVARIADEVAVMRRGVIVEQAPPATLFHDPRHPYTRALIAAQPEPDIARKIDLNVVAQGAGSPEAWPEEFRFAGHAAPPLRMAGPGHKVRCHA